MRPPRAPARLRPARVRLRTGWCRSWATVRGEDARASHAAPWPRQHRRAMPIARDQRRRPPDLVACAGAGARALSDDLPGTAAVGLRGVARRLFATVMGALRVDILRAMACSGSIRPLCGLRAQIATRRSTGLPLRLFGRLQPRQFEFLALLL